MMIDETPSSLPTPEFSRPLNVESLKIGKSEQTLEATPDECAQLAQRFDLLTLDHLSANVQLNRKGAGDSIRVFVSGRLNAGITQSCVITLDPVSSEIEADFNAAFDSEAEDIKSDCDFDISNDDIAEPIIDGSIDLGELVAQYLAVEIDPFPRKEGADGSGMTLESANTETNPFSVLKKLKSE